MTDTHAELDLTQVVTPARQPSVYSPTHAGQAPYAGFATPSSPFGTPPLPPGTPPPTNPPARSRAPRGRSALAAVAILLAGAGAGGYAGHYEARHTDPASSLAAPAGPVLPSLPLTSGNDSAQPSGSSRATAGTPQAAAAVIAPSVVTVEVTGTAAAATSTDPLAGGGFGQQQQSQPVSDTGSGIVLRSDGYIVTNNHVVAAAKTGGTVHVTFTDGRTVSATIVGTDATSDIAVIKVDGVTGLKAATFADSDALSVGQAVLAVGAPLGLSNTVTQGIVSTVHRPVATGESGASAQSVIDAVQTDAAINPGNSGGALVNLAGQVVGINSAIASTGSSAGGQSGNIGVGFAIPSNDAKKVSDQLIATGHATHAQIGISVGDAASDTTGAPGLGATVSSVTAGGPAATAGLQAGDVITKVATRRVTDANSLIVAVRASTPKAVVTITYTRGGATRTAQVTLGTSTAS